MNIGDKVYILGLDVIGIFLGKNKFEYIIQYNKNDRYYERKEFLTLEQVADIFANKELEQLILNYKK
jgi:hypothetical protein